MSSELILRGNFSLLFKREFGIGLLSFWTVGESLTITSAGKDGITRRMKLVRNNPGYSVTEDKRLMNTRGTELIVEPHKFSGRLLRHLPRIERPMGEIYQELYTEENL
jgi:hypothetical protein